MAMTDVYIIVKKDCIDDYKGQLEYFLKKKKDGGFSDTFNIIQISEVDWNKLVDEQKRNAKKIFIGNVKDKSVNITNITYHFEKYGVKIGSDAENTVFIRASKKNILDKAIHMDFLSELSMLDLLDDSLKAGWSNGLCDNGNPKLRSKVPIVQTLVVPFGFVKTIADDVSDDKLENRQLLMYGLVRFYETVLNNIWE